jgi:hypothetical protein
MNVGIGYELAHSKDSYVDMKTLKKQVKRFIQFYQKNKDIKYVQDVKLLVNRYDDCFAGECELCGMLSDVDYVFGHIICIDCFEYMFYGDIGRDDLSSSLVEDMGSSDFSKITQNGYIGG